jgi:hypothetical protein
MCRCSLGCVNHKKKLEEIVCRREGRLYDEYCRTSDALIVTWLELSVAECQYVGVTQFQSQGLCDLECELLGRLACEKFDFVFVLHIIEDLFVIHSFEYRSDIVENLLASLACLR